MKGYFQLTTSNIKSAIIYGLLTIGVTFLISVINSIMSAGSIYGLDWAHIIDKGVLATLGVTVTFVSLIKNLLTDKAGNFLSFVEVIPDKDKQ